MNFICIDNIIFPTDLAISEKEQAQGLMFRNVVERSMTFCYDKPQVNKFWMKNTFIPLDIVFCRGGKVIAIMHGEPHSEMHIGPDEPSDLVIEMPSGTARDFGIKIGSKVELLPDFL